MQRGEVIWTPSDDAWSTTAIGRFAAEHGFAGDYDGLVAWSRAELDEFWAAATEFCGMRWMRPPHAVRVGDEMPGVAWFPGGELNYADQALAQAAWTPDAIAVVAHGQTREPETLTWAELADAVARCAAGLRRLGVGPGDRVTAFAPNIPETAIAVSGMFGAIWSSCAPEFGVRAVVDRLGQIEPKVLVAVDGYRYGAKDIDRRDQLAEIVAALPSLRHVVDIAYLRPDGAGTDGGADRPVRLAWDELLAEPAGAVAATPVAADHPLYVLFSSGTTGLPKAIVHGHGGIVAEHLKLLRLHHDLGPGDRLFWFTTTGWMMWNYVVSGLLVGSAIVLFDGDPAYPSLDALWDLAAETGVTLFGTSAPFLMTCRKQGVAPSRAAIREVGSTGSPLPADGFRWVADRLGVRVASVCGGTDVATAFIGASPVQPVRAGEIGGRLLGCAVEAFTPDGEVCPPGVTGELVITAPMPSMPVGFWRDDDGSRYRAAYFEHFPGVWRHGDWITFTVDEHGNGDGACIVSGRSDATLNRGGVRLGTADFYTVVEDLAEIADSLVVHLEDESGDGGLGELLLFVTMAPGAELTDELRQAVRRALAKELSPRHTPDAIEAVPIIPRTLSGKKLELPVKRILAGIPAEKVASRDSLADPTSLDWFIARAAAPPSTR